MWTYGRHIMCPMQIFGLLAGRWLFNPQEGQTWRIENLTKTAEVMGENSSEKTLARSRKRDECLDESTISGKLLRIEQLFPMTLESAMIKSSLSEAEAAATTAFIHACLHLDPEERFSVSDLLEHPWLESAYMCLLRALGILNNDKERAELAI
ncbi:uncharacterized protein BJ212DRAFT_1299388 [Suillus subaureus]|uniref:non-specific serine/threonine protein kinase n=1 Tax=Suillus subaureus TaxID=48587 RepID=A0A9P7ECE3_9AGAM|nr:uncharacterized protein BJ212DRAFT_1299388 [Suillus subaureus]KAG1817245.1 hypothetical protein BJ212DRAFT_1299388 [Suillus subaureus]